MPHQPLAGLHVPDVHLLQVGWPALGGACGLAVGGACSDLSRPLADAVQGSGLKHSVEGRGGEQEGVGILSLPAPLTTIPPPPPTLVALSSPRTISTPREIKDGDL